MNAADKAIRWSAAAVVAGVAGTAGWVSYTHALDVTRLAGEADTVAYAYPTFIDGVVYMSSMVLLAAARGQRKPPPLAWWSLATGIEPTAVLTAETAEELREAIRVDYQQNDRGNWREP